MKKTRDSSNIRTVEFTCPPISPIIKMPWTKENRVTIIKWGWPQTTQKPTNYHKRGGIYIYIHVLLTLVWGSAVKRSKQSMNWRAGAQINRVWRVSRSQGGGGEWRSSKKSSNCSENGNQMSETRANSLWKQFSNENFWRSFMPVGRGGKEWVEY